MKKVIEKAYGKINLSLDVLGRREDGYHEVSMVMQTVDIYDRISLSKTDVEGIRLTSDKKELPLDEKNIVYKAVSLIKEEYRIETGVDVHIEKQLPIAAGMGGGSADAAAALRGMNRLFNLGLNETKLEELGLRLGADVPFLIRGGTALAEGIGERLTELVSFPECAIVIVKPKLGVSTKEVYEAFDSLLEVKHPDIGGLVKELGKSSLCNIVKLLGNVLEEVTVTKHRIIAEIKQLLLENGAVFSMMTGSGPTVFGIFESEKEAKKASLVLRNKNKFEMVEVTQCRYGR
ncbi:MAG: 4-(cytidine 5'-diphospho)-2-C-methyl-D-erythritol kinase [Catonella sp.]|uniref:4-(cytidine 5'-diphospho)-2-C-methyl-D-erythritol kinase n=1 Tax=Catonella sp. TaxID=2382125 RepID=UPI003F9FE99B